MARIHFSWSELLLTFKSLRKLIKILRVSELFLDQTYYIQWIFSCNSFKLPRNKNLIPIFIYRYLIYWFSNFSSLSLLNLQNSIFKNVYHPGLSSKKRSISFLSQIKRSHNLKLIKIRLAGQLYCLDTIPIYSTVSTLQF